MNNVDLGLLVLAIMVLVVAFGTRAVTRQFGRDRIFRGVTPGQLPPSSSGAAVERVEGGREYRGEVAVQFHPPLGLTPGLVGTVVDGRAEMRDVTATILDLAVRGHLTIKPLATEGQAAGEPSRGRAGARVPGQPARDGRQDWLITKEERRVRPTDPPLLPFERRLLVELFAGGPQARMSELGGRFGRTMHDVREDLYTAVQQLGWYDRHPQQRGGCARVLPVVLGFLGGLAFFAAGASVWSMLAGAGVIAAGFVFGDAFTWRTPRTALGTAVQIQTLGFKKYLETAEADQIRFEEAADIFSRYLPYAIVFGVADRWAKLFGEVAARAREAGVPMAMEFDWIDGIIMIDLLDDVLWASGGVLDMLGGDIDLGGLAELGGDALGGLGDFAGSIGDFVDGIDLDFFDF